MTDRRFVFRPWIPTFDPNVHIHHKAVFTPEECDAIVAAADKVEGKRSTMGYSPEGEDNPDHRDCHVAWIDQDNMDEALQNMWQKFHNIIVKSNNQLWGYNLSCMWEKAQYTKYKSKQHFGFHFDTGKNEMALRKISSTIMLNDSSEYTGGVFQFFPNKDVKMEKGDVICFPSYLLHRVTPVTSGERKTMVLWAGGAYYN